MFGVYALGNFSMTGDERIVADVVQQSFISFAKTGIPTNNYSTWDEAGDNLRYLSISPYPQMKSAFDQGAANLWHSLRSSGFDLIQMLPTQIENRSTTSGSGISPLSFLAFIMVCILPLLL
ncbi:unnamed protein product [Cylicostephanus goldi]|uniref:Uncharacterized protein n=1 Tax=Cylicostephanus goldi TaxID=71465 RepID=A0A3P7M9Y6_CYLGO|nr:unnamed protein product [Cylicostephanus goldi]